MPGPPGDDAVLCVLWVNPTHKNFPALCLSHCLLFSAILHFQKKVLTLTSLRNYYPSHCALHFNMGQWSFSLCACFVLLFCFSTGMCNWAHSRFSHLMIPSNTHHWNRLTPGFQRLCLKGKHCHKVLTTQKVGTSPNPLQNQTGFIWGHPPLQSRSPAMGRLTRQCIVSCWPLSPLMYQYLQIPGESWESKESQAHFHLPWETTPKRHPRKAQSNLAFVTFFHNSLSYLYLKTTEK